MCRVTEPLVKICGLQGVEVLKSMNSLPLDYVGLVFAPSRRRVTPGVAAELIAELGNWKSEPAPRPVGVFVNPALSELVELLRTVPLDVVQLHGQESPQFCAEVKAAFPRLRSGKPFRLPGAVLMRGMRFRLCWTAMRVRLMRCCWMPMIRRTAAVRAVHLIGSKSPYTSKRRRSMRCLYL